MLTRLKPWRRTNLQHENTWGEIELRRQDDRLQIWILIDGTPRWFDVSRLEVIEFIMSTDTSSRIFRAVSIGNAENVDA